MLAHHRGSDEVDMLLGKTLVPGQNQDVSQALEYAGKAVGRVVDGFPSCQGEGEAAAAEGALIAKDLALKRRLLDIAGRRGDPLPLQARAQGRRSARPSFSSTHKQ